MSMKWYERKRARSNQGTIKLLPRETKKHLSNFSRLHTADTRPDLVTEYLPNTILDQRSFTDFSLAYFFSQNLYVLKISLLALTTS